VYLLVKELEKSFIGLAFVFAIESENMKRYENRSGRGGINGLEFYLMV
jgi:hypothetical protein